MAVLPPLADRIVNAQIALDRLLTGALAVEVDTGTYHARFTPADVDKLQSYLDDLIAQQNGTATTGAIGFVF